MKKINTLLLTVLVSTASLLAQNTTERTVGTEEKMLHISDNLTITEPTELFERVDLAKEAGANSVLFSDSKFSRFGINGTVSERWDSRMREFVAGVKARGMKINLSTITMGFAGSLLFDTPDLTTGYPIQKQELVAQNGQLIPINSVNLPNSGFELTAANNSNQARGWFQDKPGTNTFIDTEVKRSGNSSLRAEAKNGESSRAFTTFDVKPFHQYVFSFWMKTQELDAGQILPLVINEEEGVEDKQNLTQLRMSLPRESGKGRRYYQVPNKLTITDWTEVRIAFNSQDAQRVKIGLAIFRGKSGTAWFDDVKIEDAPTLNWLAREDLNVRFRNQRTGQFLTFGTDINLPEDEFLGDSAFEGNYDTQHEAPIAQILNSNSVQEGDIIEYDGWHALPTVNGQVSASWNNEVIFAKMRQIHKRLYDEFQPDGFLLNYSEIRTGGFEPSDNITEFKSSGDALGTSMQRALNDLFEVAPDAKYYFWSDMIDENHNAIEQYYQIKGSLEGMVDYVDPDKVTLLTWWEGQKIIDKGNASLQFFADRGFDQIVGAFYDEEVEVNYTSWQNAAREVPDVIGSVYATWVRPRNFAEVPDFGKLWWQADNTLSAKDIIVSEELFYNNPVKDLLKVNLKNDQMVIDANVYDVSGRLVRKLNQDAIQNNQLDLSNLNQGIYLINVESNMNDIYKMKIYKR